MKSRLRTAVIGTSWWADGFHLPGLQARQDVDLVALCGRDPARLAAVAERFSIPQSFTDYQDMLNQTQPDVVVVLTPNHLHHPMTLAAIQAGAHVVCEKPLALTVAQAREMLKMAQGSGRRHMVFYTYRGLAAARWVKRLVTDGYLGDLHHVNASYLHGSWLDSSRAASWKTRTAQSGTGVLADLASHVIDLVGWWFGPITRVTGSLQTFIDRRPDGQGNPVPVETDDAAALVGELQGGGQALVQVSRVAPGRHNYLRVEMYGRTATLVLDYEDQEAYVGRVSGAKHGDAHLAPLPIPADLASGLQGREAFAALYGKLTDGFFRGEGDYPTFADGLRVQQVIDAVARAAGGGTWQELKID